ncbi:MAG: ABC transporter permease, partial [Gemmatimonadaceae bacterium]
MSRLEFSIAWRYLRSRRGSRLLSLISMIAIGGVIVGVSALIVIIGVMNGLQEDLREKILIGTPDVRVLTYGADMKMTGWQTVLRTVRQSPGVVAAAPFVLSQAGITAGHDYGEGVFVMGIEPARPGLAEVTNIRRFAVGGDFGFRTPDGARRGVVLGRRLADRLQVQAGVDTVTIVPITGVRFNASVGTLVPPPPRRYLITGVFETGMYEYDNSYLYMALEAAQDLTGLEQAVTGLEVRTIDRWSARQVARQIADTLGFPYRTDDWQAQNSSLFQALKLEKLGMSFILLLIVIVAAFNIVSTLTMVVTDKTREIGILRAMGMPARSIRRIFFAQGIVIGVVGTATGLLLGLAASVALGRYKLIALDPSVYFIDHLPVDTQIPDVALIVLASLAIA